MEAQIRVINIRATEYTPADVTSPDGALLVYVGRSHPSGWPATPLGNPFHIGKGGHRWDAIRQYREWLQDTILKCPDGPEAILIEKLRSLVDQGVNVDLLCWCSPKPCHADVVRRAILRVTL
jgi:hypothetical protein